MENVFPYRAGAMHCEGVRVEEIAAATGTPVYVYSSAAILERFRRYDAGFGAAPHRVCYAVKANSNLAILALLARAGAGFDIVSGGELYRVLAAGGDPQRVVFSGVGKTQAEMEYALRSGIHSFNAESEAELAQLNEVAARLGMTAQVGLRVNPDVDAATHPYISTGMRENKFGIDIAEVERVYARAAALPALRPMAVSCHIGSQMLDTAPMLEALDRVLALIERLRAAGIAIRELDFGGGLGVAYQPKEVQPDIGDLIAQVCGRVAGRGLTVMVEPGRSIVGEAGALLSRVILRKRTPAKEFVVVDAAMNDLIRPALYGAHHEIRPVREREGVLLADVVGPVCESGDFLARDRQLAAVDEGDLLAIGTAGAYGFAQASNYNTRPRAAEVLVSGDAWRVVRDRETYEDLVRGERY
jgi:diaminopimelate decarboxylase